MCSDKVLPEICLRATRRKISDIHCKEAFNNIQKTGNTEYLTDVVAVVAGISLICLYFLKNSVNRKYIKERRIWKKAIWKSYTYEESKLIRG